MIVTGVRELNNIFVLKEEKIVKAIVKLCIPSILTSLVMVFYNVIDTFYISMLHDNSMIAATTVALPLMIILQAFGDGIGMGTGSYIGRLLGMNRIDQAKKAVQTSITISGLVALVVSVVMLIFLKPLIGLFKAEADVVYYTSQFMSVLLIGGVFLTYKQVLANILRAQGQIKIPMIAIMAGVISNIVLNPILMFEWGLNLKVMGSALATILSQLIGASIMMFALCSKKTLINYEFMKFGIDMHCLQEIVRVGSSAFARQSLPSISSGFLIAQATVYGTDFLASVGIARKCLSLVTSICIGYAQGIQPFLAFNYGAKNRKRITEMLKISTGFAFGFGMMMCALFYFKPDLVLSMYTRETKILYFGAFVLQGYAYAMPILGVYQVFASTLQAFGKSKESLLLAFSKQLLFYAPAVLILTSLFQEKGIYYSQPVTEWCTIFMLAYLCKFIPGELKSFGEVHK